MSARHTDRDPSKIANEKRLSDSTRLREGEKRHEICVCDLESQSATFALLCVLGVRLCREQICVPRVDPDSDYPF